MNAWRRIAPGFVAVLLVACAADAPGESTLPSTAPAEPSDVPSPGASSAAPSASSPAPGGQLAFLRDGELIVLDLETGAESATGITDFVPMAFTTDNGALIGVRTIPDNPHAVRLDRQPLDGSDATVLAATIPYQAPAPSPDGRFLLFGGDGAASPGLVLVDLESGDARELTTDGGFGGIWSPDGITIAYSRVAASDGHDLFIVDVASGATRQLTNDEWEDDPFRWTEDGTAVLTTSHRGGDGTRLAIHVWQIEVPTGEMTERPDLELDVIRYELFSPDGRWRARISHQNILSITQPDRGVGNRLGPADSSTHLTWSPNSAWLAWANWEEPGAADLYMVHAPDGEPIRITRSPESESHPVWGPIRHGF